MVKNTLKNTTLILLTLNEIEGLTALLPRIPLKDAGEVLLMDGGSTDGTVEFAKKHNIRVISQKGKGRGDAFREGCANATKDVLVFFSPDGNEEPEDIQKLVNKINDGYDMVIATRFSKEGKSDDATPLRRFGNSMFTLLINLFFGVRVTDAVNGFRAIRRPVMNALKTTAHHFEIEIQMTMRCAKKKYRIAEIPTYEHDRIGGYSKVNSFKEGLRFIKVILKERFMSSTK